MARRNKSYAQSMEEWSEEKRFLRKIRGRAFHPNYDSPLLMRLGGYLVRFVILAAIALALLFLRNRSYFNGDGFRDQVKSEVDRALLPESSEMDRFSWKNDSGLTNYSAQGGPNSFFKSIDARRVRMSAKWRELILTEGWNLKNVEIGELRLELKGGQNAESPPPPVPDRKKGGFLQAVPDFSKTRFGDIQLHTCNFEWGPFWSSKGSFTNARGVLNRDALRWTLNLTEGTFSQNWLKGLALTPEKPMRVFYKDGKIAISDGQFSLGLEGTVSLNGIISTGTTPEFDLKASVKNIALADIIPPSFTETVTGIVDIEMKISGSTNTSDGIGFDGVLTFVSDARLRGIPILGALGIFSSRSELRKLPIRSGSTIKFKTRRGKLSVTEINLVSGEDIARVHGHFDYKMDTTELERVLEVENLKRSIIEDVTPEVVEEELGFSGEVSIGMPWALLQRDAELRDQYFKHVDDFGWITTPLKGSLEELTAIEAKLFDEQLAAKERTQTPFGETTP